MKIQTRFLPLCCLLVVSSAFSLNKSYAADQSWDGGAAGTANLWLTNANWVGDTAYAGAIGNTTNTDIATFTAGTNTASQVNFTTAGGNFSLGAVVFNRGSTTMTVGANTSSGLYRLNGATVSSVANTLVSLSGATDLNMGGTTATNASFTLGITNGVFFVDTARTLTFQQAIGEISAGSGFTKTGAGILRLDGTNTFSGGISVNAGRLQVTNSGALGTGTTTLNGTGVELRQAITVGMNNTNAIIISDTGDDKTIGSAVTGSGTFSGNITVNETTSGNFLLNPLVGSTLVFTGDIGGSGGAGVKKIGSGIVVLSGNNSYTGDTVINVGTLKAGSATALSNGAGKGNLSITGGTFDLNGYIITANALSGSTGQIVNDASSTTGTLTVGAADATGLTLSSTIKDNSGTGGTLALTKIGTGAQTLSGNNTYSGGTKVQNGSLRVSSNTALGTGSVSVEGTGAELRMTTTNGIDVANNITISDTGDAKSIASFATTGTFSGTIAINESTAGNFSVQSGTGSSLTISGAIGGSGGAGLKKTGAGSLILTAGNSYSGPTNVTLGALQTNSGATLGAGNVTLADTAGVVLTLGSATSFADTATLTFGSINSVININFSGNDVLGGITNGSLSIGAGTYTAAALNTFFGGSNFVDGGSAGTLQVVPEPATWALLAFSLTTVTILRRRQRH